MKMVTAISQAPGIAPENRHAGDLNSKKLIFFGDGGWRPQRESCRARAGSRRPGEGGGPPAPRVHNYIADLSGVARSAKPEPNWGRNQPRPGAAKVGAPRGNRNAAAKLSPELAAFEAKVRDLQRRARAAIASANALIATLPPRPRVTILCVTHIRDGVVVREKIVRIRASASPQPVHGPGERAAKMPAMVGS